MQLQSQPIRHERLEERLRPVALRILSLCVEQRDLSYELLAQAPEVASTDEASIRSWLAHKNRPIVHIIPKRDGSRTLCGRETRTPNPVLDGFHSYLSPYCAPSQEETPPDWSPRYNQKEACPDCWLLARPQCHVPGSMTECLDVKQSAQPEPPEGCSGNQAH
jgi:hypothetical protein